MFLWFEQFRGGSAAPFGKAMQDMSSENILLFDESEFDKSETTCTAKSADNVEESRSAKTACALTSAVKGDPVGQVASNSELFFEEELEDSDPQALIKQLTELVNRYNEAYYNQDESLISDHEYDVLKRRLSRLEEEFPQFVQPNSPTQKVGGEAAATFQKVTHQVPMLSMDNALDCEELAEFGCRVRRVIPDPVEITYVTELKIDGLAMSLVYEKGRLVLGATRGNGRIGEDVTANIWQISDIPHTLPDWAGEGRLEVRGEVYMRRSVFQEINAQLPIDAQKANPRNLAAGSLRQKDPQVVKERHLSFFAYTFVNPPQHLQSQSAALSYLHNLGFKVCRSLQPGLEGEPIAVHKDIESVVKFCQSWNYDNRQLLDFDIDGIVVKLDDFVQQSKLGYTSTTPNWAIAYKFPPQEVETVLEDVIYQVGRTGSITPVAVLRPVQLEGSTVSRASLHNFDYIRRLGVRIGDHVTVYKAAAIIPQIGRVIGGFKFIDRCPSCGSSLVHSDNGKNTRCPNFDCPERLTQSLSHFCSRNAMNIEGIGTRIAENLVRNLGVHNFGTLYGLSVEALAQAANSLILGREIKEQLERSKSRSLEHLLFALGIEDVGLSSAINLASHFGSLDSLIKEVNEDPKVLDSIPFLGGKESIPKYFKTSRYLEDIELLRREGVNFIYTTGGSPGGEAGSLHGLVMVITGTLDGYSRVEGQELLRQNGAKVASSVTKNTSYLVRGTKPGEAKLKQAQKYNVPIIDQEQLRQLIETGHI